MKILTAVLLCAALVACQAEPEPVDWACLAAIEPGQEIDEEC